MINRIETGFDWIQVTCETGGAVEEEMRWIYSSLAGEEEENGNMQRVQNVYGYSVACYRHIGYGRNQDHTRAMFRASGYLADEASEYAAVWLQNESVRVTRLDVQSTVWYNSYMPDYGKLIAGKLKQLKDGRRRIRKSLIDGMGAGDTLYIGATSSDRRLRMYDKFKEQKDSKSYENAWRYEIQYRSSYAAKVLADVAGSADPLRRKAEIINAEFGYYDITVAPEPCLVARPGSIQRDTDTAKRVRWLQQQVAPPARQLAREMGWDYVISLLKEQL